MPVAAAGSKIMAKLSKSRVKPLPLRTLDTLTVRTSMLEKIHMETLSTKVDVELKEV